MWTPFGSVISYTDSVDCKGVANQRTECGLQYRWVFRNGGLLCGVFQNGRLVRWK